MPHSIFRDRSRAGHCQASWATVSHHASWLPKNGNFLGVVVLSGSLFCSLEFHIQKLAHQESERKWKVLFCCGCCFITADPQLLFCSLSLINWWSGNGWATRRHSSRSYLSSGSTSRSLKGWKAYHTRSSRRVTAILKSYMKYYKQNVQHCKQKERKKKRKKDKFDKFTVSYWQQSFQVDTVINIQHVCVQ